MFSTGFSFGRARWQQDDGEVLGDLELVGAVPPGAVHQDDAMGLGGDVAADLVEMHLHGGCVGEGEHESGTLGSHGTDCAKEVGVRVALIGGQAWPLFPSSPKCAHARSSVPAWPRLGTRSRPAWSWADRLGGQRACGGSFFERLDHPLVLLGVLRPDADVGEGQRDEKVGDRPLAIDHAKRSSITRFRSTRRQRTTPSISGSGPVSTITDSSPICSSVKSRGGPHRDGSSSRLPLHR